MLGSFVAGEALEQAMIDGYISTKDYADLVTLLEDKTEFLDTIPRGEVATLIKSSLDENLKHFASLVKPRKYASTAAPSVLLTPPFVSRMHTNNKTPCSLASEAGRPSGHFHS